MPEAYLLLGHYKTTRPGLLVLDADGRRVDSISLPGLNHPGVDASTCAKRLRTAHKAPALEYVRATIAGSDGCKAKVRRDVLKWAGVQSAEISGTIMTLRGTAGSIVPSKLMAMADGHSVFLEMQEPVQVNFAGNTEAAAGAAKAFAQVPGVWYTEHARSLSTYVTGLLLQPKSLAVNELVPDVEARVFDLPGVPKGGAGARVARAPLGVAGVVSVFPDIFNNKQTVIGRNDEVDWDGVLTAFEIAGCKARARK